MDYPIELAIKLGFYLILLAIIVLAIINSRSLQKKQKMALYEFVERNGLALSATVENGNFDEKLGLLFQLGTEKVIKNKVTGTLDDFEVSLYKYQFIAGSGKQRRQYSHIVCEVKTGKRLPHILLDSEHSGHGINKFVPEVIQKANKIQTPVELGDKFTMYVQTGLEQEALELFTPSVLNGLKQYAMNYYIELVGDSLYVYSPVIPEDAKDYQYMFETVKYLIGMLRENLNDFEMPQLPTKPGANLDEPRQLTRLKFGQKLLYKHEFIITLIFGLTLSVSVAYLLILLRNQ